MSRIPRAVLDTDVIFSRVLHELFGRLAAEARLMDLLWSDELLDEARRVLVERKPLTRGVDDRWVCYLRAALGAHGVEVADPDAYLCAQLDTEPEAVLDALDAQRRTWGDGERTMDELLDAFGRARTPDFAQRVRDMPIASPSGHGLR